MGENYHLVWLENDQLNVENYDFCESAHKMFGNDIAYTLNINEMNKPYLLTK